MFNISGQNATSFELTKSSSLIGKQVIIYGENITVRIDNTSTINVTATSDELFGTYPNQGAAFISNQNSYNFKTIYIGEGGNCALTDVRKTYGLYNQVASLSNLNNLTNQIGSQGVKGD